MLSPWGLNGPVGPISPSLMNPKPYRIPINSSSFHFIFHYPMENKMETTRVYRDSITLLEAGSSLEA